MLSRQVRGSRIRPPIGLLIIAACSWGGCNPGATSNVINTNPEASITSPAVGESFKPGTAVPLEGTVTDVDPFDANNYPDFTVQWTITGRLSDGSRYTHSPVAPPPSNNGQVGAETATLGVGEYTVQLLATDTRSAQSDPVTVDFIVENSAPRIGTLTCPSEELTVAPNVDVEICGNVTDGDDPEDGITISLSDSLEPALYYYGTGVKGDGSFKVTARFQNSGTHNVYVIATDPNGGFTQAGPVVIKVRNCSPYDGDGDGLSGCDGDCDDNADPTYDNDSDGFPACDPETPDCDDNNPDVNPAAAEGCDGIDTNCDGALGDDEKDEDGDGFRGCTTDCDDSDPNSYYGATEICDAKDNNCDGAIPYTERDRDGDGYLDEACSQCEAPTLCGDCDDDNPDIGPALPEVCGNGIDDNCNNEIDEDYDGDRDGYSTCTDCDDTNPFIYPGAVEGPDEDLDGIADCDGLDNDCDQIFDEGTSCVDDDLDGYTELEGDCDDYNFYTHPGAIERPDFQDNNCDSVLEGTLTGATAHVTFFGDLPEGALASAFSGSNRNGSTNTDIDADGISDLLIGASSYDVVQTGQFRGAAFLLFGRTTGWDEIDNSALAASSILLFEEEPQAMAGTAVAMAGDLNGDGFGDFAVGVPDHSTSGAQKVGLVYVMFGQDSGWGKTTLSSASFANIEGIAGIGSDYTKVGFSMAGGADVNGDGFDDLVVNAPWLTGQDTPSSFGWTMILAGKYSGWDDSITPNEMALIYGTPNMVLGRSAAIAGFTNGDGVEDLVIGALYNIDIYNGAAVSILGDFSFVAGSTNNLVDLDARAYYGGSPEDYVGDTVSGQVDLDNDGYEDILIGKRNSADSQNLAHVILGSDNLDTSYAIEFRAQITFTAPSEGTDVCPCIVQGLGDMNGDGLGDMAIGIPQNADNGNRAGKVYIFYGRGNREDWGLTDEITMIKVPITDADLVILGENAEDEFGATLGAADLNNDGWQDLIIAAPGWDSSQSNVGKVYIIFGYPPGRNPIPAD